MDLETLENLMARQRNAVPVVAALLTLSLAASITFADDAADLIKSKGLTAVGNVYTLPAEKETVDGITAILALREKVKAENKVRDDLENKIKIVKSAIQKWDYDRRNLFEAYTKSTDIGEKNNKVAAANVLDSKIKEADAVKTDLETKINGLRH